MNNIFAREPIFTINKQLYAYQFVYRNQEKGAFPLNVELLSESEQAHQGINIDELMQVTNTLVNLSLESIEPFIEYFSSEQVMVEIFDIAEKPDTATINKLNMLKAKGFTLVIMHFQTQWPELVALADFVKCEIMHVTPADIVALKQVLPAHTKTIATQVHTQFQFEQCAKVDIDYIQGFFFLDNVEQKSKPVPASKLAYMQLMTEIAKPELNIDNLQHVFEKDPTLSFLLMKFINNPLVNKSYKISSIRHALNFLGELMVKRFVAIISLAGLNSNKPNELLNVSLARAKYCELVDAEIADYADAMTAFLVGLFSLLDVILSRPIAELLKDLDLDEKIELALVHRQGRYAEILQTAKDLESGSWTPLVEASKALGVSQELLFEQHRQAVRWQNDMSQAISPSFPVARPNK